jgi:hypothetical protein
MKIDRDEAFLELKPPAGGAAGLRARLAAEQRDPSRSRADDSWREPGAGWRVAAAGVAALLVIAILTVLALNSGSTVDRGSPQDGELYAASDFDRLLGRPSTPYELSVSLDDERLELTEIPTRDPLVRIVRIEDSSAN